MPSWGSVNQEGVCDGSRSIPQSSRKKSGTGQASSVVSSFTDVTARRDQMQRLDLTITGAGLGVWDLNLFTGGVRFNSIIFTQTFTSWMNSVQRDRFWESLIHPEDRELARKQLELHLLGESPDYRSSLPIEKQARLLAMDSCQWSNRRAGPRRTAASESLEFILTSPT